MARRTAPFSIVGTLCIVVFLSALVLTVGGCEWGVTSYVLVGVMSLAVLMSVPYVARRAFQRVNRLPAALGFALAGLVVWLLGWYVAFARADCGF